MLTYQHDHLCSSVFRHFLVGIRHTHSSLYGYICLGNAELKRRFLTVRLLRAFNGLICIENFQENQCFQHYTFLEVPFCWVSHITRASWSTFWEDGQKPSYLHADGAARVLRVVFTCTLPSLASGTESLGFWGILLHDNWWHQMAKVIKSAKCVGEGLPTFPHLALLFFHQGPSHSLLT